MLYKLGWFDYEGNREWVLSHEKKFGPIVFKRMVLDFLEKYLVDAVKEEIKEYEHVQVDTYLSEDFVTAFCAEYGFERVEFEQEFSVPQMFLFCSRPEDKYFNDLNRHQGYFWLTESELQRYKDMQKAIMEAYYENTKV